MSLRCIRYLNRFSFRINSKIRKKKLISSTKSWVAYLLACLYSFIPFSSPLHLCVPATWACLLLFILIVPFLAIWLLHIFSPCRMSSLPGCYLSILDLIIIPSGKFHWPFQVKHNFCSTRSLSLLALIDYSSFQQISAAKSLQSCLTLCDPIDSNPPGFAVAGILQARTLEWVAISFSNAWKWKVKVKSLSRVRFLATPWTAAHQAAGKSYWSGLPLPSPQQIFTECLILPGAILRP